MTLPGMLPKLRGGQPRPRYFRGYPKICGGLPRPQYFWECFRYSPNSAGTPKLQGAPPPSVLPGVPLLIREAAPPPILPGVPLILQGAALHPPSILPGGGFRYSGGASSRKCRRRGKSAVSRGKYRWRVQTPEHRGYNTLQKYRGRGLPPECRGYPPEVPKAGAPPGVFGVPAELLRSGRPQKYREIKDRNRFSSNYFLCWVTRETF